jgi:hypothetical protein
MTRRFSILFTLLLAFAGSAPGMVAAPPPMRPAPRFVIVVIQDALLLEVWNDGRRIRRFEICALSTRWGRKTRQGDGVVPQGIYRISAYRPRSASHKTLALNYPNAFDRSAGCTGSGIGIHGNCASSGCIGLSNPNIDSLYALLDRAPDVPVLIFPTRDIAAWNTMIGFYQRNTKPALARFTARLLAIFREWERTHRMPAYHWDRDGYLPGPAR